MNAFFVVKNTALLLYQLFNNSFYIIFGPLCEPVHMRIDAKRHNNPPDAIFLKERISSCAVWRSALWEKC